MTQPMTPEPTITRQDYMMGRATHRQYYAQFVDGHVRTLVRTRIGVETLQASQEPHFNDIPLVVWDRLGLAMNAAYDRRFRQVGDTLTYSGATCVLKEAARQLVEQARVAK